MRSCWLSTPGKPTSAFKAVSVEPCRDVEPMQEKPRETPVSPAQKHLETRRHEDFHGVRLDENHGCRGLLAAGGHESKSLRSLGFLYGKGRAQEAMIKELTVDGAEVLRCRFQVRCLMKAFWTLGIHCA